MGEYNKRRYKSGISYENPFYTGLMVPASLQDKPPIELTHDTAVHRQPLEQEENSSRVQGGYRNKNLNSLVSSQIIQPTASQSHFYADASRVQ